MKRNVERILITAGPTREPIDPVRFISNRSSGKMGYALAEAARAAGYETVLISGPVSLIASDTIRIVPVVTADEMFDAVEREIRDADVFIMCAAVADYTPSTYDSRKEKKEKGNWSLALRPTKDILATATRGERVRLVMGFAAETHDLEEHAIEKMRRKRCDLLVANDVSHADFGMESDYNAVKVFGQDGHETVFEKMPKRDLATALIQMAVAFFEKESD